jgi:hypothetical protein
MRLGGAHGQYRAAGLQTVVPNSETSPYFYEGGGQLYCVGFSAGFDEAYRYCSETRVWPYGLFGGYDATGLLLVAGLGLLGVALRVAHRIGVAGSP